MSIANNTSYLEKISDELAKQWPGNQTINIVCHGHSVPSGYFATPYVDTFHAYPYLLHRILKERFPYAVLNVIVTAIGGENAEQGAERFERDVLIHAPKVLTIDYGLNDRQISLKASEKAWREMIEKTQKADVGVILLTPSWEQSYFKKNDEWKLLVQHSEQIRGLASEYGVGLADTFGEFMRYVDQGGEAQDLLSHINHPSYVGHQIIATAISRWFMAR